MSDNLDLIRGLLGAEGERRDFDPARLRERAERDWEPEIVYTEAPDWPGAGTFRGVDEILGRFDEYNEALGILETEIERIEAAGPDRALAVLRAYAKSPAGVPTERRWAFVFTFRDSKVVGWRAEMDPERARSELGLD